MYNTVLDSRYEQVKYVIIINKKKLKCTQCKNKPWNLSLTINCQFAFVRK